MIVNYNTTVQWGLNWILLCLRINEKLFDFFFGEIFKRKVGKKIFGHKFSSPWLENSEVQCSEK